MQANILTKLKKIIIAFITAILTMQSICFANFTDAQKQEIVTFVNKVKDMNTAYTITDTNELAPDFVGRYEKFKLKKYGRNFLSFYRLKGV